MDNKILPLENFWETVVDQRQPYKVIVRVDDAGRVVEINSSAFVQGETFHTPLSTPVRNITSLDPFIHPVQQRRTPSEPEPI